MLISSNTDSDKQTKANIKHLHFQCSVRTLNCLNNSVCCVLWTTNYMDGFIHWLTLKQKVQNECNLVHKSSLASVFDGKYAKKKKNSKWSKTGTGEGLRAKQLQVSCSAIRAEEQWNTSSFSFFSPQSMEELISKSVPENIRLNRKLKLDEPLCECGGVV